MVWNLTTAKRFVDRMEKGVKRGRMKTWNVCLQVKGQWMMETDLARSRWWAGRWRQRSEDTSSFHLPRLTKLLSFWILLPQLPRQRVALCHFYIAPTRVLLLSLHFSHFIALSTRHFDLCGTRWSPITRSTIAEYRFTQVLKTQGYSI